MKLLYIAEIVGKAGLFSLKKGITELKLQEKPDFIIACADGVTSGNGLGRNHAAYVHKLGVQTLTTGECCFYKKDLTENLEHIPYVLRPENLSPGAPGFGSRIYKWGNHKVAVVVLLGQSGFSRLHGENPFTRLPVLLERLRTETPCIIVDFHAEATAEKYTLFKLAEGRCSAIIGSHNRVQTADERVLPGGTAVICDAGRTGSQNSVGGNDREVRIREYLTGIPDWTREAWDRCELQGVLVDIDPGGRAAGIRRLKIPINGGAKIAAEPGAEESTESTGEDDALRPEGHTDPSADHE